MLRSFLWKYAIYYIGNVTVLINFNDVYVDIFHTIIITSGVRSLLSLIVTTLAKICVTYFLSWI